MNINCRSKKSLDTKGMLCVGVELARMSQARHSLYMVIAQALVEARATYHLPPYPEMETHMLQPRLRPPGEGSSFIPPYLRSPGLRM